MTTLFALFQIASIVTVGICFGLEFGVKVGVGCAFALWVLAPYHPGKR